MTKHSTLTNANDLHYAKFRSFTGSPNAIAPDFVDQILTATDTNKIYRATGTSIGALIEMSASLPTTGTSDEWIFLGEGIHELELGKKYISATSNDILCRLPNTGNSGKSIVFGLYSNSGRIFLDSRGMRIGEMGRNLAQSPLQGTQQYKFIELSGIYNFRGEIIFLGGEWSLLDLALDSTIYTPTVYGCTDPNASNYNSLATVDDGNCEYN